MRIGRLQIGFPRSNNPNAKDRIYKYIALFLLTFMTMTIAGTQWLGKDFTDIQNWQYGLYYAVLLIVFLSSHEFGHYFASRYHKVKCTLPYFIPFIPFLEAPNFGTFGAVIKTKQPIPNKRALFDIGLWGPLPGFIVSVIYLIVGFLTLPSIDYLYAIHPEYKMLGTNLPVINLFFGDTALYHLLAKIFASPSGFLPPMNEMYHYPLLNAGWFGLFVTSMNLLPLGQLDGGHILHAMFGKKQKTIAKYFWWGLIILGSGSLFSVVRDLLTMDYTNSIYLALRYNLIPIIDFVKVNMPFYYNAWGGWLFWAFVTRVFIKLEHPPIIDNTELDLKRKILGWFIIAVIALTFCPNGIYIV